MRKKFFYHIFSQGGPLWFFQFFYEILNEKSSKMTFLEKKFQGCLKICLRNDLFFVKLKSEQKNFKFFFQFFSSNSQFSSSENDPRKSKVQKKFCTASPNEFKITHAKIQTFLIMGTQKSMLDYLQIHLLRLFSARPCTKIL